MVVPIEVQFHGVERSEAVEARIAEKVAWLEKHFSHMTHCRVVVEAPHRKTKRAAVYHIKIEIGVPGQQPLVISHDDDANHEHEDIQLAIRDAFNAARRRVDALSDRITEATRTESARRKPNGRIGDE